MAYGRAVQLSADFSRMLMTSFDGVLELVSRTDGAVLTAFQGDKQFISAAADSELRWIVATDQGGQIHFLHLEEADGSEA
jgi:hypothetical protein